MITYLLFTKIQQKYSSNPNCERIHRSKKGRREWGQGREGRRKGGKEERKKKRKIISKKDFLIYSQKIAPETDKLLS